MRRSELTDEQWQRVDGLLSGQPGSPGRSAENNRLFLDAVLWVVRTGAPWRDLPERFGEWNSVFQDSTVGRRREFGSGSSMLTKFPIWSGSCLMPRLFGLMCLRRVLEKKRSSATRAILGRTRDEDSRGLRRSR